MDGIANVVTVLGDRITNNVVGTFANMTAEKWIRLIIIVGACELQHHFLQERNAQNQLKQNSS